MATLPARPNLGHLRRQARDVLRAAQAGDITAVDRIRAVSDRLTLAAAQLAVAREYGFASWAGLKAEVEARTMDLAQQVEAFCTASIRDWTGRAARMLAATPEIAGYSFATAVILGDARVRREIKRRPDLVTRPDDRSGWTPLHAVCGSQWHQPFSHPARADGLLAVARLLLEAGADPAAGAGRPGDWTPLRWVAGAANPPIARLLLERGAAPEDHDLYLAGFADDGYECLRLLLSHTADVAGIARTALSAPISRNDLDGVRLLLAAGADPRRYDDDATPAVSCGVRRRPLGLSPRAGRPPACTRRRSRRLRPGQGARRTPWPPRWAGPRWPPCCDDTAPSTMPPASTGSCPLACAPTTPTYTGR